MAPIHSKLSSSYAPSSTVNSCAALNAELPDAREASQILAHSHVELVVALIAVDFGADRRYIVQEARHLLAFELCSIVQFHWGLSMDFTAGYATHSKTISTRVILS